MNRPPSRDEQLSGLLQAWQVDPPDDPALARKVWARIEAEPVPAFHLWLDRLARALAQPAMAAAMLALFAAAGALTAELRYSGQHAARLDQLATEYAQSIDPVHVTGLATDRNATER